MRINKNNSGEIKINPKKFISDLKFLFDGFAYDEIEMHGEFDRLKRYKEIGEKYDLEGVNK